MLEVAYFKRLPPHFSARPRFSSLKFTERLCSERRRTKGSCQGKVEISYSLQSRNVLFCPGGERVRVILALPVKRRRAMLASNPIEE